MSGKLPEVFDKIAVTSRLEAEQAMKRLVSLVSGLSGVAFLYAGSIAVYQILTVFAKIKIYQ